jgi:preprotein translocase subunit SecD
MKTISTFILVVVFALFSCNSGEKSNAQKVSFGIYETVKISEIPGAVMDVIKTTNINFESDTNLPIVGYVLNSDTTHIQVDFPQENIRLVKTVYTVDKDRKYNALVAIKQNAAMDNSDIQKTKNMGTNVEIHFNTTGARKWAEVIKNNQEKMMAFVIDHQIYSLPYVNGKINNGSALISSIENEATAKDISESLNSGIIK